MTRAGTSVRFPDLAQVIDDGPHAAEPGIGNRGVLLDRTDPHLRAELQVSDAMHQSSRKREPSVLLDLMTAMSVDGVQEHQRLVQGEGADRILQQELRAFRRELQQRRPAGLLRGKERAFPFIDALLLQGLPRRPGNRIGTFPKSVAVDRPIDLRGTRKMRHGRRLDANAADSEFLAFDHCRAGPAERVQNQVGRTCSEAVHILSDQVGREREDESVPVVYRPVFGPQLVPAVPGAGSTGENLDFAHCGLPSTSGPSPPPRRPGLPPRPGGGRRPSSW